MTAAVAIGMSTATVAILRLPLSAVVITTLLTSKAGPGAEPLVILGVVVSSFATLALSALQTAKSTSVSPAANTPSPAPAALPAVADDPTQSSKIS